MASACAYCHRDSFAMACHDLGAMTPDGEVELQLYIYIYIYI